MNPGYGEIDGLRCYPSIAEVPEPVDLAILGVANARIERALLDAAGSGARSVVTFSSLYEEEPPEPGAPPLLDRVAAIAREHGMALCGGNGMGFLNLEHGLRATGFHTPDHLRTGPVTFISHSGSAFTALAFNDRGVGFNLIVSSGQEIVTTMAEYMEYSLGLSSTRVLALLLETVRDPERFRRALSLAQERNVPVIALKVGRVEASKAMVTAHSGALAGEHGVYEALFDTHGVLEVETLDEMADTMEMLSCPRRITSGSGLASVHDSGGERAMFVDLAHDIGVPFARVSESTLDRIQAELDPGIEAANPLDAWGTGIDSDRIFRECLLALAADPDTAVVALVVDLARQDEPSDEGYLRVALDVFAGTEKPFCALSNLASAVAHDQVGVLRAAGVPVLEGTASGLRALRHLFSEREHRDRPPIQAPVPAPGEVRERWRARLAGGGELSETEGLSLLADYGVPVVRARAAASADEAVDAAIAVGFPVALKTAAPGLFHKSDVGGVRLGLADADAVRAAYREVSARLGPQVTVAAMAPEGTELALGVVRDPQFGPLVLVAAGGVLVEILRDRRLAFPPLDEGRAGEMLAGLKVRSLLGGARGAAPVDVASVSTALSRLSVLAAELGDLLEAVDVNPVIASPVGCLAVDALVVARPQGEP
ncbi:MAG: acetate--CoA ligase family protein [Actinobacteria bacterium]|nr:acetate--CoA ligase family protein [Actinomycetota bacterium]